jgi:hypothetical protein
MMQAGAGPGIRGLTWEAASRTSHSEILTANAAGLGPRSALRLSLALARVTGVKTVVDSLLNDLGVAASIVIVAGGILGVYKAAVRIYSHTAGSRRDLARRLNELAAG